MHYDFNDDPTIIDSAMPEREISDDITREHVTEPGLLAAACGRHDLVADEQWTTTFRLGGSAMAVDIRRALVDELMSRGATKTSADDLVAAVFARMRPAKQI